MQEEGKEVQASILNTTIAAETATTGSMIEEAMIEGVAVDTTNAQTIATAGGAMMVGAAGVEAGAIMIAVATIQTIATTGIMTIGDSVAGAEGAEGAEDTTTEVVEGDMTTGADAIAVAMTMEEVVVEVAVEAAEVVAGVGVSMMMRRGIRTTR